MGRGGLWRNGDEMTLLLVDAVADNYFDMLGVKPVLGRLPDPKRDAAGSEPPILMNRRFRDPPWLRHRIDWPSPFAIAY